MLGSTLVLANPHRGHGYLYLGKGLTPAGCPVPWQTLRITMSPAAGADAGTMRGMVHDISLNRRCALAMTMSRFTVPACLQSIDQSAVQTLHIT